MSYDRTARLVAPPLMVMIILIANNKKVMGNYVNKRVQQNTWMDNCFSCVAAGILLIIDLLKGLIK